MIFESPIETVFNAFGGIVFNVCLIIFNTVSAIILMYVLTKHLHIHRYNPYRTSPFCAVSLFLAVPSLILIDLHIYFPIEFINFWTLQFIWSAVFMNIWLAFYGFVIWRGVFIRSIIIHANMVLNAIYFISIIVYDTFLKPFYYSSLIIGLCVTIFTYFLHHKENYVPSPVRLSKELKAEVKNYIQIFKTKKEIEKLKELTKSSNEYVQEHANKTLQLVNEDKISSSNLKNNLFLLMLIDKNISIGKFRKIFYKKKGFLN
ncbi:MAG: hypothetical protein ACTSO9_19345 [Candidatus Helarchaeota archaeon]